MESINRLSSLDRLSKTMCRMVGAVFKGAFPSCALSNLRVVSEIGKVPNQGDELDGHRDGWGMVSFSNGSPFYVGRSARPIHLDPSFDSALSGVAELERPNILICHARRGSEGEVNLQNTQPFLGSGVAFAHNGSVKAFRPETSRSPRGSTDSERVFAAFLDRYDVVGEVEGALSATLKDEISGHNVTGLVFLISDGTYLYGYRDYGEGNDGDYYNMKFVAGDGCVTVYQQSPHRDDSRAITVERGCLIRVGLDLKVDIKKLC